MTTINIVKGQKIDVTKGNAGLTKLTIGLGWDVSKFGGSNFDLDASAAVVGENGKLLSDNDFVFFNNLTNPTGSVASGGDNLTGAGAGDDETITVDLSKLPAEAQEVHFAVTIFDASKRGQNFGMVANSYVRVLNADDNSELIKYDLGEDYSTETTVITGKLYRHNGEWKFNAIGEGFAGEIGVVIASFQ